MNKFQIRILLLSSIVALSAGSFSVNLANASEIPPAPLQLNNVATTPLSFVGMMDMGGTRIVQTTAMFSPTEQTNVRMAFPLGTSDRAVRVQVLSRTTIQGSHQTLVSLKVSGIDLWKLTAVDLSSARILEISNENIAARATPKRSQHWNLVTMMPEKGLSAGNLVGYRLLDDGSILIQFKKSNTYAQVVPTFL